MGKLLKIGVALVMLMSVLIVSCQNDAVSENTTEALTQDSDITALLMSLSVSDTITRTVIDSTSCFSVKLPVQVVANGQQITITNNAGYAAVEQVFNASTADRDELGFIFPITITYATNVDVVVNSQSQYNNLVNICKANAHYASNCVAINYPITIFSYNSRFQRENTYVLNNNAELYSVLLNIGPSEYYSVNYPVTLTVAGQETVSVNNNMQLQQAITTAITACGQQPVDPVEPSCNNPGILTDSLKIYMPFSGNVRDLKGSAVTAPADTLFVADRTGNPRCALAFNGNQSLRITSSSANAIKNGDELSISLWLKMQNTDQSNFESLFAKGSGGTNGFYLSVYDNNTPMFGAANFQQIWDLNWNQTAALHTDTANWHHVVITLTANYEAKIYRDGVLRNTQQLVNTSIGASALDYYIGQDFRGWLDDLRVYKKVLSQADVQTLYQLPGDCNTCLN
jgi:hypothetical protein